MTQSKTFRWVIYRRVDKPDRKGKRLPILLAIVENVPTDAFNAGDGETVPATPTRILEAIWNGPIKTLNMDDADLKKICRKPLKETSVHDDKYINRKAAELQEAAVIPVYKFK